MKHIKPFSEPVYVTHPLLPDLKDLNRLLKAVWQSGQLTNNGPLARCLEREMSRILKVKQLSLFSNGTLALQIACRVLELSGEVITTPFTYAATPNAIALNNLKPVFCDVDDEYMNIDTDKIEGLITPKTSAIVPVHVFGNPCRMDRIEEIARKYGLRVIYDAAHAFGVEVNGRPAGDYGDISMFSLHATKIFHTVEGGVLVFNDRRFKEKADLMRNFGIKEDGDVCYPGTNAKLNEVQAAVGILVLKMWKNEVARRKEITLLYRKLLSGTHGIRLIREMEGVVYNYSYFVVRVDSECFGMSRDELFEELRKHNVICRKYFYPLCSSFSCYKSLESAAPGRLETAEKAAGQVLSLPLHGRLSDSDVEKICEIIRNAGRGKCNR
jgi:dTDP-4-amino-4,6-dideoxygalactose transaminase